MLAPNDSVWDVLIMNGQRSLKKLHYLLISKAHELGNPGATSDAIIDAIIEQYPAEVEEVSSKLLRSALARELSRTRQKAPLNIEPTQATLWSEFKVQPQIIVHDGDGRRLVKNLDICTGKEVRSYAGGLPVRKRESQRKNNLLTMADEMKTLCPEEDKPLGPLWQKFIAHTESKVG